MSPVSKELRHSVGRGSGKSDRFSCFPGGDLEMSKYGSPTTSKKPRDCGKRHLRVKGAQNIPNGQEMAMIR